MAADERGGSILVLDRCRHYNRIVAVQRRYALRKSRGVLVNRVWLQGHGQQKYLRGAFEVPQFASGMCQVAS
jgi:hypothetical protein